MGQQQLIYAFVGAGHGGAGRVHRVHRQLHHHRGAVPPEAPRQQQQVHLQLRRPHLQLPRRGRIQSKLKEHMQYCVDHPEEVSKLAKVKAQVSEVKGVMMENIEKVLDRGEKIELLVDRLKICVVRQQGTKVRRKMWLQNMKIKLIVLGIIIALILIIILSVCHGFNCGKK
ncbi:hypothetical protein HU200_066308 [Digitaria exilis]|uniref:V-SNARE coiled-coil homology domain-containing protein n=1 Tax=Digitaria exilis TaxID=1010633 RepID=A0A835A6R2_9POAL|nr:hypothetical protein HU200_066308 [Digitaria exilis]